MAERLPETFSPDRNAQPMTLFKVAAKYVSYSHTLFAYCAFIISLMVGCYTHYEKIVRNEHFGYPDEWFPSVSATTGDRYPARAIFHIFIALTSGPRFLLVMLWYLYTTRSVRTSSSQFGLFLLAVGVVRTVACGGWVYITSSDDHLIHDVAMILYLVCTLPWQLGVLKTSTNNAAALKWRRWLMIAFFGTLGPMIYYFLQHKVHKVPGAYTTYAFFEWSLILYDVAFDAVTAIDFQNFEITVLDMTGGAIGAIPFTKEGSSDKISPSALHTLNLMRGFVAESYLAFVFWSMLTSLALLIWYFPLWHMGISGYEAFLFITLMPIMLGIGPLRRLIAKHRSFFHLISLVGIASYLRQDPVERLSYTALGLGISLSTWAATWIEARSRVASLERSILIFGVGLIIHNVVKMAWWTENPIWPIMNSENGGTNAAGIVLAVIAVADIFLRDIGSSTTDLSSKPSATLVPNKGCGCWFEASCGFGAVLFALHSMYTDSSAIMRWSVAGYPDYGPEPVPWGVVTIIALALGLLLSSNRRITLNAVWYVIGCAACAVFYVFEGWTAYYGGLVLGLYLMSVMPALVKAIADHGPFKTMFTSFMIYNVLCLAHVWVVAYAFVPGGVYARERTNWVLASVMFLIGLGVRNARKQAVSQDSQAKVTQIHLIKNARFLTKVSLVGLVIASALVAGNRSINAVDPVPYRPAERSFTAAIWTIHFALDNSMWASERAMRDTIRDLELDVVGLLESDTMRIIMGNRDWAQYIAEDLGYYIDYGPSTMKHTWGCLMLSKFPIIKSTHHLLPSPVGELACAIHATLDVHGQPVDFIVSHNGQEEDPEDRRLQTTELARIMRESRNPFVFLGYVVTKPQQPLYHLLFDGGDMNDIDPSDWDRWCQYIGYRGMRRVAYARVSRGNITDTEIQTGKFQVVDDPAKYWKASYERRQESDIIPALRYPEMFRGDGVRGHRYHMANLVSQYALCAHPRNRAIVDVKNKSTGELSFIKIRHRLPDFYAVSLVDPRTFEVWAETQTKSVTTRVKTIVLPLKDIEVQLRDTSRIGFEWSFDWEGERYHWVRQSPLSPSFECRKTHDSSVVIAQYLSRGLKDEYFGLLATLRYNMMGDSWGLELVVILSLLIILDKSDDKWNRANRGPVHGIRSDEDLLMSLGEPPTSTRITKKEQQRRNKVESENEQLLRTMLERQWKKSPVSSPAASPGGSPVPSPSTSMKKVTRLLGTLNLVDATATLQLPTRGTEDRRLQDLFQQDKQIPPRASSDQGKQRCHSILPSTDGEKKIQASFPFPGQTMLFTEKMVYAHQRSTLNIQTSNLDFL
ncbi:hypothetical protein EC973_006018 [Apophysomyces ossiformis]|uniref:Calcofluor white hypersensitive protein n=1 Tax=Apophysomyces ossiformis TaxID=679940 RepID=A0A8H7BWC7_9FUNG|nr:hypothetical protein EC973_006018 [Apophysomyces ossiformis]